MRLHDIEITPDRVRVDGNEIICDASGPKVNSIHPLLHVVTVSVFARAITLNGDTHDQAATTPIYDQLVKETQ